MEFKAEMISKIWQVAKTLRGPAFIYVTIISFFMVILLCFLSIIYEWQNLNSRFQSLEDFTVLLFFLSLSIELWRSPENLINKFITMEGQLYKTSFIFHDKEIKALNTEQLRKQTQVAKTFIVIVTLFMVVNGILPITIGVHYIYSTPTEKIVNSDLFFPYECWVPFSVRTIEHYLAIILLQVVALVIPSIITYIWFASTVCSLTSIQYNIKSLCIAARNIGYNWKEIDDQNDVTFNRLDNYETVNYNENCNCNKLCERKIDLHTYLSHLIRWHQTIIRSVKILNDSLSSTIIIFNQACCIQICLSLYGFFEGDDTSSKLKYLLLMIPVFWAFAMFCWYGQQLINESENLYAAFAECSWIDKPNWFKKDICLILTRARHPLKIMPLNIYILNFNNMTAVLQAAYSYFNLMHTMKRKYK